ncbi:purine-nucleoside phosphorylase [Aspergillus mulundensis]|uniref:Purine nucleoside phosphorylase n=1 Tax=Aspergillus mulundensis TaxID=1810919 RepID=A0A3D8QBQ3_9EURO|nr:Purine nucleoside phosphorylase [Aspergillus mulundensis]RDW59272.1 Purine nucleoside phosphorylase [Aspergillus mulundensis]
MDSTAGSSAFEKTNEASHYIKKLLPESLQAPRIAIVCGSGLGGLANTIDGAPRVEIDYSDIPHFPRLTVSGHAGKLVFGVLDKKVPAVLMVGRAHYYEGHSIDQVTFPIRVFKLLGIDTVILTNAAGGLNPDYVVGDIVLLNDHIFLAGLAGTHPLRGPNCEELGPRFPPLSDAYDLDLRRQVHEAWGKVMDPSSKRRLHEGVYAYVGGPSYETRAECRMLRQLGADVVGMSTVPEIVVARHCGIRIIAFSLVTNNAVLSPVPRGDDHLIQGRDVKELDAILQEGKANHEEVLEAGRSAAQDMQKLVVHVVSDIF